MFRRIYRSLYWRIAIGFILCIAAVLAIQGSLILWLLDRTDAAGVTLSRQVGADLSAALTADPGTDLDRYLRARYPNPPRPFYIVMIDDRVIEVGRRRPPPRLVEAALGEFHRGPVTAIPASWEDQPFRASAIVVNGRIVGAVGIVPETWMEQLGTQVTITSVVLLIVGTTAASLFIFGPAHRRLRELEKAARRLGSGDLDVRAEADGGDEVAEVARTFNQMADDLAGRAKQIAASERARRLLLADVSHELMTPLTAIRGYQEKLSGDVDIAASESRTRIVRIIGDETRRLERLVGDLLDLARMEGGASIAREDVSVEGLFGRVAARHGVAASERRIRFSTCIEPGAEIVIGDAFRLEQALQNLAANAIRHTPAQGSIELSARLASGDTLISIHDSGHGIAPEHLPFVFDRFYKADQSRSGSGGSGLGLSIVRAIVGRHGGTVSVASQLGQGTTFTIRLPAYA
jgi:signal transduction histidine kinase